MKTDSLRITSISSTTLLVEFNFKPKYGGKITEAFMKLTDYNHTITDNMVLFWGGPFSQWAKAPFTIGDLQFNCAEQYMMYQKASVFGNLKEASWVLKNKDPRRQKAIGRLIRGLIPERWDAISKGIVYIGNLAKFSQNEEFKKALIETGDRTIVEASPHDKLWGIGLAADDLRSRDMKTWRGKNWLGDVLMYVREDIKGDLK
jgi:ribA/ribD-fused uncharacterized protein